MYREMILVGHSPPEIVEDGGHVRCVLIGGDPVEPVRRLTASMSDDAREDVDVALVLYYLLDQPRIDAPRLTPLLQKTLGQARDALRRAAHEDLDGSPLIEPARTTGEPAYRFGDHVRRRLRTRLPYVVDRPVQAKPFVLALVRDQGMVRNGDVVEMCGLHVFAASRILAELRNEGVLAIGSAHSLGQGVFHVPGPLFPTAPTGPQTSSDGGEPPA